MTTWPTAALGELFDIARGGSPRPINDYITDDPDGVNWVSISDATESAKFIRSTKRRIKASGVSRSRMVHPGDVLLTNSMSFGRPYIMATSGCIHDGWLSLSPKQGKTDPDYLFHILGSPDTYRKFERLAAGATVKNLNIELVRGVEIPLPPLDEQRRIAAILDQADALGRKRLVTVEHLDQLQRSTLATACQSGENEANSQRLSDLLAEIQIGPFGTLLHKSDYVAGGVPLINPMHIVDGEIVANPSYSVSARKSAELKRYALRVGDIVMGRRGDMGRCAVVNPAHAGILCGTGSMVLRVSRTKADPDFLADYIRSPKIVEELQAASSGVTMANLNQDSLNSVKVNVPSISTQLRYSAARRAISEHRAILTQSLHCIRQLFDSLQQRAFAGEL